MLVVLKSILEIDEVCEECGTETRCRSTPCVNGLVARRPPPDFLVWQFSFVSMAGVERRGYTWALSAGLNAALAAIAAKFVSSQFLRYGLVILFNVMMWGCYVNSLKALSSLQATVTNFAANFLTSGLAGFFLFKEPLPSQE
ncbi:hypothetical protein ZIOFF_008146 [Zingiber officinale]|uniref:Uncharacterized protein n=1 Tax=Zingiber officinale TaxID=94328 RepID=A0A8J5I329_ZINOF|nr:hypothetical protein ZIOFF_008146 [Zingiber officinale]